MCRRFNSVSGHQQNQALSPDPGSGLFSCCSRVALRMETRGSRPWSWAREWEPRPSRMAGRRRGAPSPAWPGPDRCPADHRSPGRRHGPGAPGTGSGPSTNRAKLLRLDTEGLCIKEVSASRKDRSPRQVVAGHPRFERSEAAEPLRP